MQVVQHSEWNSTCSYMHTSIDKMSSIKTSRRSAHCEHQLEFGMIFHHRDQTPPSIRCQRRSSSHFKALEKRSALGAPVCLKVRNQPRDATPVQHEACGEPCSITAPGTGEGWYPHSVQDSSSHSPLSSGISLFSTLWGRELIKQLPC